MENSIFSQVPSDVLGEIFVHCLPGFPSFSSTDAPLALTQVCRAWRTTALESVGLWKDIRIPRWQRIPKNTEELVRLWIERSASAYVTVDLGLFDQNIQIMPEAAELERLHEFLNNILNILAPHRGRILSFRGVLPEYMLPNIGLDDMTKVERLFICGTMMDMDDDDPRMRTEHVLTIGPVRQKLKSLAICGITLDLQSVFNHTQITYIELVDLRGTGQLGERTALEILKAMPLLHSVVLDVTIFERDFIQEEGRYVLQNLELLFLTWTFPADIAHVLDSIATPSLVKLGLRGTPLAIEEQWPNLHTFLLASQAPINRLSIGDFGEVDFLLVPCLQCCPNLNHLTINHCDISDLSLRELTPTEDTAVLSIVPQLKILNLGVCDGFTPEVFVDFLKSRSSVAPEGISKLSELGVLYCIKVSEAFREEIESCGIEEVTLETMEVGAVLPYARVIETHQELLALLFHPS